MQSVHQGNQNIPLHTTGQSANEVSCQDLGEYAHICNAAIVGFGEGSNAPHSVRVSLEAQLAVKLHVALFCKGGNVGNALTDKVLDDFGHKSLAQSQTLLHMT